MWQPSGRGVFDPDVFAARNHIVIEYRDLEGILGLFVRVPLPSLPGGHQRTSSGIALAESLERRENVRQRRGILFHECGHWATTVGEHILGCEQRDLGASKDSDLLERFMQWKPRPRPGMYDTRRWLDHMPLSHSRIEVAADRWAMMVALGTARQRHAVQGGAGWLTTEPTGLSLHRWKPTRLFEILRADGHISQQHIFELAEELQLPFLMVRRWHVVCERLGLLRGANWKRDENAFIA
ncbi:MAG TPA: hypothetical protein VKV73_19905 [Chloroflexota bacterium]|nr:hypothetical protein [Chloroflexota bacterium]